jgi:O-antigen/teichoic acid export membrane protein
MMIRGWRKRFSEIYKAMRTNGSFVQNSLLMFSSSGASMAIQFGFAFILSRIYSENDYGIFQVFNSYVAILASFVTLNYNQAFVLPRDERQFVHLFQLTVRIAIWISIAITILSLIGGQWLLEKMNHQEVGKWIYLVGPTCLAMAFAKILRELAIRQKAFLKITIWSTASTLFAKTFNVTYGSFNAAASGLIITNILAFVVEIFLFVRYVTVDVWKTLFTRTSQVDRMLVAKEYRSFPLYIFPGNLINTLSNFLPPVLLATLGYGYDMAGFYGYAILILDVPLRLMANGVSSVFLPKANDMLADRPEELGPATWRLYKNMILLAGAAIGVIFVAGEPLYSLCFSERWAPAGRLAEILAVYYFFRLISAPLAILFNVLKREKQFLIFQSVLLISSISSLSIASLFTQDFFQLMQIFSIANGIVYFGLCVWIFKLVNIPLIKAIAFTLFSSAFIFSVGYLLKSWCFV